MEITNAKKGSDQYMTDWCDYIIGDLVKEKTYLIKAYNYFNGVRDHFQYEHLEKNYGIGNPTSIGFTPLTRKHIEAIVGEYLSMKPTPRISCKDQGTLTNIFRDKQLELSKQTFDYVSKFLNNAVYQAINGNPEQQGEQADYEIQAELNRIKESVDRNFISNYEIAAQNICQYVLQDRQIDFKNKLEQLILDLLIAGEAYYKVSKTSQGTNFKIELCDPLNTWVDKDPKSRYMKNGYKSVVRKWMTPEEIEIKYGDYLTRDDLKAISEYKYFHEHDGNFLLISGQQSRCGDIRNPGMLNGIGAHPLDDDIAFDHKWNLIPVYEVEWIDSTKKDNKIVGKCYSITRIGSDIYVTRDVDDELPHDIDSPEIPRLSINGLWYTNGHGAPYSLMLATADLQDNYDMLLYKKDNLIALSGTAGAIVDIAQLPEKLGASFEERLMNYNAYRKVGMAIIDTAQEGQQAAGGQFYGGFNDTQGLAGIQYIQAAIQIIEDTVSSITGVFRERLGGIQQRDAVANVEVGMQQSYIITKRYYNAMDTLVSEILTDCMDVAKSAYKKGITGQLILGDRKEFFKILPEYYTTTSFDIHLADSAEIIKEQELIKQLAMQLASSSQVDPEILLIVSTSKSLTEMKELTLKSIREKKIENNQIQQLSQQLQEAQKNMQDMQKQLEASTKKIAQLNERKLNIEQQNNQMDQEIAYAKIEAEKETKNRELDLIEQRNKLEAAQLFDNNPNNDQINFSKKK